MNSGGKLSLGSNRGNSLVVKDEDNRSAEEIIVTALPLGTADTRGAKRASVRSIPSSIRANRFYRPELDVLRFFAFFGVFLFHTVPHNIGFYESLRIPHFISALLLYAGGAGSFGVDLFFALSAYLITSLLLRERTLTGELDLASFYVRRILRIWPLYLSFVLLATLLPLLTHGPKLPRIYIVGYSLLAGNWIYVFYGLPASVAIPLWTVSIEEQFYLTWPVVFRRLSVRSMGLMALIALLATNLCRVLLVAAGARAQTLEYSTVTRLDPIVLGILMALFAQKLPRFTRGGRIALLSSGVGTWICVSAFCQSYNSEALQAWRLAIGLPLTAVASAAILLAVLGSQTPFLKNRLLVYLGKISYGLYVVHMFALSGAARLLPRSTPTAILMQSGVGFVFAILLAAASYHWLERPFLKLKERFSYVQSRPL